MIYFVYNYLLTINKFKCHPKILLISSLSFKLSAYSDGSLDIYYYGNEPWYASEKSSGIIYPSPKIRALN